MADLSDISGAKAITTKDDVQPSKLDEWVGKHPNALFLPPGQTVIPEVDADDEGWVAAPGTSHISRFKRVNAHKEPMVGGGDLTSKMVHKGESPYQLYVIFKGKDGVGESVPYVYFFQTVQALAGIYNALKSSGHPYGEQLYPKIIKPKSVPYRPATEAV